MKKEKSLERLLEELHIAEYEIRNLRGCGKTLPYHFGIALGIAEELEKKE